MSLGWSVCLPIENCASSQSCEDDKAVGDACEQQFVLHLLSSLLGDTWEWTADSLHE